MSEDSPLNQKALGSFSTRLAEALFAAFPFVQQHATMIRSGELDGLSLNVVIPSPSRGEDRFVQVWVDEVGTPSVGFGPGHTHFSSDDAGISETIDLCRSIFDDKLLIATDVGGDHDGHSSWIDLRDPDALEEALTSPYSPGRASVKSWSGNADRIVGVDSL